jgi:hypothetical protein
MRHNEAMRSLLLALALTALVGGLSGRPQPAAAAQQTFWQLSTGAVASPYPSPSSYPVNWYGTLYYPPYWPVCRLYPYRGRCRPPHASTWPPHVPFGHHPIPRPGSVKAPAVPPAPRSRLHAKV